MTQPTPDNFQVQPQQDPTYAPAGNPVGNYANPAVPEGKNTLAAWALGFGILSIVMVISIGLIVLAFIPGVITIILAALALSKQKRNNYESPRKGMAIVSLSFGILATLAALITWIMLVPAIQNCQGLDESEMQECISTEISNRF